MSVEFRLGRYQQALADVTCDALITDTPYSERTQSGHASGTASANRVTELDEQRQRVDRRNGNTYAVGKHRRRAITYKAWTPRDVFEFVTSWSPRVRGWMVCMTDHTLMPHWEMALNCTGRYVFPPLPFVAPGSRVRMRGDGPALWAVWIMVARPATKQFSDWGALPGGYVLPKGLPKKLREQPIVGGKPLWLMRELVEHYSRAGDTVCDPCAGAATTLLAARDLGRVAIGAERAPAAYRQGLARLEAA